MKDESIGSKILRSFKSLDMYGTGSKIGIRGAEKSNSVLGSIITLIAIFASLYLTSSSISDMVNKTNPTITRESDYDIHELQINSSSLNISFSFFKPLNQSPEVKISNNMNDYNYIQKFYNLNYTCYNCTGIEKQSVVITNSTPCRKPQNCSNNTIFLSLDMNVPFNYSNYPSNNFSVDIKNKYLLINSSLTKKTYQNINISSYSKTDSSNILNLFNNYSFTFPDNFSATILDGDDNGTFTLNIPINTVPKPPDPNFNQPAQNPNQPNSNQPAQNPNQTNSNQPAQNPNQTNSNQPSQNPLNNNQTNSNQPPQNAPKNRTNINQKRSLQNINFNMITIDNLSQNLNNISAQNTFPKVLLFYSDIFVNKAKSGNIYYVRSIDYMDLLTQNPISYYVYLQQTDTIIDNTFIWTNQQTTTTFSINSIVKNDMDTSKRNEASLIFKVFPIKINITVKYVSLSDVLSALGSYYSVCTLIASIFCYLFSEMIYQGDIVNSVFKFREGGILLKMDYQIHPHRKKRTIRSNSLEINDYKKKKNHDLNLKTKEIDVSDISFQVNQEEIPHIDIKNLKAMSEIKDEKISISDLMNPNFLNEKRSLTCNSKPNNEDFKNGKIIEIGPLNLFCLLYAQCCLNSDAKSDFMKRCVEIIDNYTQIESIIRCQMEVNFLKKMLLTKSQKIFLSEKFKGLPVDDLNYSNKLLDELEGLVKISEKYAFKTKKIAKKTLK